MKFDSLHFCSFDPTEDPKRRMAMYKHLRLNGEIMKLEPDLKNLFMEVFKKDLDVECAVLREELQPLCLWLICILDIPDNRAVSGAKLANYEVVIGKMKKLFEEKGVK